jgi:zinc transporter, ZIP family
MPNRCLYAFILSFLAGISTVIGALVIFFDKRKNSKIVEISLSFAAGVMTCVSLTDLLPNSFRMILDNNNLFPKIILSLIFMTFGIIISMLIDKYLPDNKVNADNKGLYKIGIISMVAIVLHNVPEGIATFITSTNNLKLGLTITIAIALHNIPEGISIAVPIYHSSNNKLKAFLYALLSGMSEVLGSILAYLFLAPLINDHVMAALYAVIAGIMIHISVYELIPGAYKESTLKNVLKYFLIGFGVMILSHLLMN